MNDEMMQGPVSFENAKQWSGAALAGGAMLIIGVAWICGKVSTDVAMPVVAMLGTRATSLVAHVADMKKKGG